MSFFVIVRKEYNMIEGASEILLEAAFYLYESRVL